MSGGGFDPVRVAASAGDTVLIEVEIPGAAPVVLAHVVSEVPRPPVIVRVNPPPKKRDVPLNAVMVVVFSEPIDSTTLSAGVRLLRGGVPVGGSLAFRDADHLMVEFTPDAPLAPLTDYELAVTTDVRDLGGAVLVEPVSSDFTTGSVAANGMVVVVTPAQATIATPDPATPWDQGGVRMTATVWDTAGTELDVPVAWSTSNPAIATVDTTGWVRGVTAGTVTVTAAAGASSGSATIEVLSLTIQPASAALTLGDTLRFTSAARDVQGQLTSGWWVDWWLEAESPLELTEYAPEVVRIAARGVGLTRVHLCYRTDASARAIGCRSARVTVTTGAGIGDVTVIPEVIVVAPGQGQLYLQATVRDANGVITYAPVTWSSSMESASFYPPSFQPMPSSVAQVGFDEGPGTYTVTALAGASTRDSATVTVLDSVRFSQATVGANRLRCYLTAGGEAFCQGDNQGGALGYGLAYDGGYALSPTAVAGGHTFASISAGAFHVCAVDTGGAAYCWGRNAGRLGDGTSENRGIPTPVVGGLSFASISAGGDRTCALTASGAAWCWGSSAPGNLGVLSGTPASVGFSEPFVRLSTGVAHTCGLTGAGTAYCWGWNEWGQLGDGSVTGSAAPVAVAGGLVFAALDAGARHTCGVTTAGAAYCWGAGAGLKDGEPVATPLQIDLPAGVTLVGISTGDNQTCGLASDGAAYCWGFTWNWYDPADETLPPVRIGDLTFASVAAGYQLACGVTTGGITYCWDTSRVPGKVEGQP